jgi:Tol biopolymer transport system component
VKRQLEWIQAQGSVAERARSGWLTLRRSERVAWALAGIFALVAGALLLWRKPSADSAQPVRFELVAPRDMRTDPLGVDRGAISPDGRRFAFTAFVDGRTRLVMRDLGSTALVVVPEAENVFNPFWSPDSGSIAYFDMGSNQLRSIPVTGGRARVLADVGPIGFNTGGAWAPGVLLFGPREGRIWRVGEGGGAASAVDTLPRKAGQKTFLSPRFLPDGRHFTIKVLDDPAVYLASTDAPGLRKILDDAASVAYAAEHLFYTRADSLVARAFDVRRFEFTGPEVQVTAGAAGFSISDRGTIVYRPARVREWRLTWFDRSGRRTGTLGEPGPYTQMVLSPRGRRVTVSRGNNLEGDLWDVDLASGIFSRLTTHAGLDSDPAWSPDERSLAFSATRGGRQEVFVKDMVSGKENPLVSLDEPAVVDEWTLDGRFVIFRTLGQAVYSMSMQGDRTPRRLIQTHYTVDEVHVSPDGQWVAFDADESGRWEVYVAAFPTFTSKRQVSNGGGVQPQWRRDGRELFYLGPDGSMMSVRLDTDTELVPSAPARLFPTGIEPDPETPQYAVTADGQRFLGLEPVGETANFTFLLNWLNGAASSEAGR